VVSSWILELPKETNRFDFDTISDVVLELRYTAREGAHLRDAAAGSAFAGAAATPSSAARRRLISVRTEMPGA